MPPRGAPRGRASAAPRGRGGSHAAASASSSADPTQSQDVDLPDAPAAGGDAPATTAPTRPPVQRLDSIARPLRGGTVATGAAGRAKFKPKNKRRDQDEREKAEQEERLRQQARDQAAAKERGRGRGRGRASGRGRGDAMGRGRIPATASGPFAQAPAAMERRKPGASAFGGAGPRSGGGGGGFGNRQVKREGGNGEGITYIKGEGEYVEPIYPDEGEDGIVQKVDIEAINLVSSDDEDVVETSRREKSGKGGMRPVRLHREEHKERVALVNTDVPGAPAASTEQDSSEDQETEPETATEAATTTRETTVKTEAGLDETDLNDLPDVTEAVKQENAAPAPEVKKPRTKSGSKGKKPVLQTEEDKAEYQREQEDIQILAEELGGMQVPSAGVDAEGDTAMDGQPEVKDKEGRLYLFQFPPVLPPLVNQLEQAAAANEDAAMGDAADASAAPVDLTNEAEEVVIKPEPDTVDLDTSGNNDAGYIGKLIVRESGRVELSWGGTIFQLGRGAEFEFLTTTLITDMLDETETPPSAAGINADSREQTPMRKGEAVGMGKVMGKFVATPIWEGMI